MFWWFERNGQYMRCEAREAGPGVFELAIIRSDGTEQVERFTDSEDLTARQQELERELLAEGWSGPHGWNV